MTQRSMQEVQTEFLAVQSEIGALELKKLTLFTKCVALETEFLEAQKLAAAVQAQIDAQTAVAPPPPPAPAVQPEASTPTQE